MSSEKGSSLACPICRAVLTTHSSVQKPRVFIKMLTGHLTLCHPERYQQFLSNAPKFPLVSEYIVFHIIPCLYNSS